MDRGKRQIRGEFFMQNFFRKLYTSDALFNILTIITVAAMAISCIWLIPNGAYLDTFFQLGQALIFVFLYRSYRNHDKNLMKALIGLSLGLLLSYFAYGWITPNFWISPISRIRGEMFLIVLAVIIIHFIINADHHSSPGLVLANQILLIAGMILMLYFTVMHAMVIPPETPLLEKFACLFNGLSYACACGAIVCIESRLDAYRIKREEQ